MEMALLAFAKQMPVATLAAMSREHDTRIWRVLDHHVTAVRAGMDFSGVTQVGMDETSARRGQDYISLFMDLKERRVLFATPGKDASTVKAFADDLKAHGGTPATQITQVTCDMSQAFINGIGRYLSEQPQAEQPQAEQPQAEPAVLPAVQQAEPAVLHRPQIIFDRFHVVAKVNEAVDLVRRAEAKTRPELRSSRYAWLKNESSLTAKQREQLVWLKRPSLQLATARAARWRDDFNGFYEQPTLLDAKAYLRRWCAGASRSRLDPLKKVVRMIEAHWDGIVSWQQHRLSNGLLEATNSLIQAAKRRARGYRSKEKMITIVYLIAGKLPLPEIHTI